MTGLKLCVTLSALMAVAANAPDLPVEHAQPDSGLIRAVVGLGATGVLGILMWRMIDVLGAAIARNTDAMDRMREHCSAKNGEAKTPPK